MPEISFYKISATPLERVLPKLLEKILEQDYKCLVKFENNQLMEEINSRLWSVGRKTFIPHGSTSDNFPEMQPVLLTTGEENLNSASILITIGMAEFSSKKDFDKVLHLFENTPEETEWANKLFNCCSESNDKINYYIQDESGNWSKN
jgi:DNA polymerase-3 subunit chi